ncbi:MAG: 3-oxoacyl-[acyl-carrier-protein] reductase [Puniceicoccales bacterium]|jgi:3-oxoacyl-[acyl-carrier protein] reductase|nr:3-oxoacyl-[acyl-carrier-protein] reductase [Puniceicoccales bacterium]
MVEIGKRRVALVTGAGRGLGEAIAKALAKRALHVICVSRSSNCERVAKEIVEGGGEAESAIVDVSEGAAVKLTCERLLAKHNAIDILINNAGITRDALLLRMNETDWEDVIRTNLTSCFYWTKSLLRGMMQNRWGRIINISSVIGKTGNFGQANYAAAKAGIIGFTKSVAKEVASRGICVNAVAPGLIKSDMTAALPEKIVEAMQQRIPMQRMGVPEDIAAMVSFLCSEEAGYITGQVLTIDGGMTM